MSEQDRRSSHAERAAVDRALFPFMPMIYVAWADGVLTTSEIRRLRERLRNEDWLDERARTVLDRWLNPDAPPSAAELQGLLTTMRRIAQDLPEPHRKSLAQLGFELAHSADTPGTYSLEALRQLEDALGVVGGEALREILPEPAKVTRASGAPFDADALERFLNPEHRDLRLAVFELLASDSFSRNEEIETDAYRELVWQWCSELAAAGFTRFPLPRELGGDADIAKSIAVFELLAFHDISLTVKYGVQFGLFGGSILQLGTAHHHARYLQDMAAARLPGCFAMTETAHGSNVRDIETTAQYDVESDEFVIHTPHDRARKDYIGGAAAHARIATVFAQLETRGESHGVHAFLVPLRDDAGQPLPGIRIEDCGHKEGLNGVDNGRIYFSHVRIPRENLLDRFGSVAKGGAYSSPIASASRRFFTMLATLVAGRLSIAVAAGSAAKTGLSIAIRYSARRRQFGPEGEPEAPILDYTLQQRALLPRLATTYALHFALRDVVARYARAAGSEDRELETLVAGLKSYSSAHTVHTLQACREACGGAGYMSVNRFGELRADTDVFTTFEGANPVLLQLVAKGLLTDYRHQFGELRMWSVVKLLANRAAVAVAEKNPIATRRSGDEHLLDDEFHAAAFRYREAHLLETVARRLKRRIDDGTDSFVALNEVQDHIASLANAYVERLLLDHFAAACERCTDPAARASLERLRRLFALSRIEADRAWFLESGYLEAAKSKAIRRLVNRLCDEVAAEAVPLTDAFGIPDRILRAPIAYVE